jgi:mannosyltransferase
VNNTSPQIPTAPSASPISDNRNFGSATIFLLLALITLAATFLRLHGLTAKSFWLDEGIGIEIVRLNWTQFLHVIWSSEANMALYYLLLKFWMMMGDSEGFIRGLSILFSVATVPLIYSLGARLFGQRAGLLAALLLGINAYHIRYAQDARSYAMFVFFAVLATWLFMRNLQKPSSAQWELYGFVCALTAYCHFFGAMLVPAHVIPLLFWRKNQIPWRKFTRGLLIFGAMTVPIVIFVLKTGLSPISWAPPMNFDSLLAFGVIFSGNDGRLLLALNVIAIGIALIMARRTSKSNGRKSSNRGYTIIFSWLITPLAMVAACSLIKPMLVPRFLIFCLPALLLLVAAGISQCRPAALAWGLGIAITVCSMFGDINYFLYDLEGNRQDWRSLTSYVIEHSRPGDSIFFFYAAGEAPFDYYCSRHKPGVLRPKSLQENWMKAENRLDLPNSDSEYLTTVPETNLRAFQPAGRRVWLVLMSLSGNKQEADTAMAIANWLSIGRHRVDTQVHSPLVVFLYDRTDVGPPATDNRMETDPLSHFMSSRKLPNIHSTGLFAIPSGL